MLRLRLRPFHCACCHFLLIFFAFFFSADDTRGILLCTLICYSSLNITSSIFERSALRPCKICRYVVLVADAMQLYQVNTYLTLPYLTASSKLFVDRGGAPQTHTQPFLVAVSDLNLEGIASPPRFLPVTSCASESNPTQRLSACAGISISRICR
jgi:hypothetical protein